MKLSKTAFGSATMETEPSTEPHFCIEFPQMLHGIQIGHYLKPSSRNSKLAISLVKGRLQSWPWRMYWKY